MSAAGDPPFVLPGHQAVRAGLRAVLRPVVRLLFRPTITGAEHVPRTGPVVLASNHLSFIDSVVVPLALPRPMYFIGKAEYVSGRGLGGRLQAWFFTAVGMIPVDRGNPRAAQVAIDLGVGVLRAGQVFGIYPEGTRSPDGRLYRGRTGVARLALGTGAVVVPCAVVGTERVQPLGARVPRPLPYAVRFGEPLDFSASAGARDAATLRAVTEEVMAAIAALSGQERVDAYASSVKGAARALDQPSLD